MKKIYSAPETLGLEMTAHDIICASGGGSSAPARSGQLSSMSQTTVDAW